MIMKEPATFTKLLLGWYQDYGRKLPWRETIDPYKIWISEIMLQQTQVNRVKEYFYPNFLKRFPTIQDLAKATWEDVFPCWKGLGYYRRGKNILKAAQIIVQKHDGQFPLNATELQQLPGIGQYTARAILAFAFDKKVPAIDTNITKIIQILWSREKVETMAQTLVYASPSGRDWNNAMMDLATALRNGDDIKGELGQFFPPQIASKFIPTRNIKRTSLNQKSKKKSGKSKKHTIEVGIACIHRNGKYLIQSRPKGKSFEGKWEFPGGKREKGEDFRACVKREILEELGIEVSVRPHFFEEEHEFEKVHLRLRFHRCQIQKGEPQPLEKQKLDWVSPVDFGKVNFLEANEKVLERLMEMKT